MHRPFPSFATLLFLLLSLLIVTGPVQANTFERLFAPKSELWERWLAHDAQSSEQISHAPWNDFLQSYLVADAEGVNRVRYAAVSSSDRQALEAYIEALSDTAIDQYSRAEQFAYWVNLYNALTVQTVLAHYPVASIRDIDISPGFLADGPWKKKQVTVQGEALSLDDIEHRILRPIWKDPRIHYAVNCAAVGCPNLQAEAFTAGNTEALLTHAARTFVNHPRGVRLVEGEAIASSIYNWFAEDFEQDGGLLAHLRRYAEPALKEQLSELGQIRRFEYDWSLNDHVEP